MIRITMDSILFRLTDDEPFIKWYVGVWLDDGKRIKRHVIDEWSKDSYQIVSRKSLGPLDIRTRHVVINADVGVEIDIHVGDTLEKWDGMGTILGIDIDDKTIKIIRPNGDIDQIRMGMIISYSPIKEQVLEFVARFDGEKQRLIKEHDETIAVINKFFDV